MENLSDPWAVWCSRPMASSTWDGSRDPDAQAEPVDTHMPFMFMDMSIPSPSMKSKLKFALLGSLCVGCPFRREYGISVRTLCMRWSLSSDSCSALWAMSFSAISAATPNPTTPGTLVVPPRMPRSCSPPWISGSSLMPFLMYSMPTPFGPPSLCALALSRSMLSFSTSMGIWP